MMFLRVMLFLGLFLHKALWEILKRRDGAREIWRGPPTKPLKWLFKRAKSLALAFVVIQILFLDLFPISSHPAALRIIGVALYCVGLATAVIGRLQLGQNWVDLEDYQVLPQQSLVVQGLYRYIRHPIYTGDILFFAGLELALNSWLVLGIAVLILVVIRQAVAEEALLSRAFPDYKAYRARTKRFIPFAV